MNLPKVLALYLPQYHETEHNNEWWGKGFTDWVSVRKAEPLFDGHKQPVVPLDRYYYDLLDKDVLTKQAVQANKYGIDGFIFYHYYFGNDRLELEKPAENLLKWRDINIPFCFSWANQSWIRTWSKFTGNVWSEKFESDYSDNCPDGILVKQIYGDENEWVKHFQYLLPFFKDRRYIRIDEKPVFIFFEPSNIGCIRSMIDCWRNLAKENGLEGLYLVGNKIYSNEIGFDALMLNEPGGGLQEMRNLRKVEMRNGIKCYDYGDYLNTVLKSPTINEIRTFFSTAVGYDTTLRKGNTGDCIINRNPLLFEKHLRLILQKSIYYENDLIIINAWNEWGEGMYLEPDAEDGYTYLEAILNAKEYVATMDQAIIKANVQNMYQNSFENRMQNTLLDKYQSFAKIYSMWIDILNNDGKLLKPVLEKWNIDSVAIYGFFDMGKKLYHQLSKEGIDVRYAIDQSVGSVKGGISVIRPEDSFPNVDCIIVTAYEQNEIKNRLSTKTDIQIYTLIELLDNRLEQIC